MGPPGSNREHPVSAMADSLKLLEVRPEPVGSGVFFDPAVESKLTQQGVCRILVAYGLPKD